MQAQTDHELALHQTPQDYGSVIAKAPAYQTVRIYGNAICTGFFQFGDLKVVWPLFFSVSVQPFPLSVHLDLSLLSF